MFETENLRVKYDKLVFAVFHVHCHRHRYKTVFKAL